MVYSSVGLHRSAISSLTQPASSPPIGQHPLISRFMRAVFLEKPPAHTSLRPTWDVAEVLHTVKAWGPTHQLDNSQLARRTLTLVALASVKRISDLTLLDTTPSHMALGPDRVVFQLKFGSKQCRPHHKVPVVSLDKVDDPLLCPVEHVRAYLHRTQDIRTDSSLFVTLTPPHKGASISSLRTWLLRTLKEAGVAYPAGSTRAASASFALAHRVSMGTILASGDWAKAKTLFAHYIRQVPASVLHAVAHDPTGPHSTQQAGHQQDDHTL